MAKKSTKSKAKSSAQSADENYPKMASRRLDQLRFTMDDLKVDGLVISHLPNVRYLTNYSGSNGSLFLLPDAIHFITDDRYEEQIKDELYDLPNLETHISRDVWGLMNEKKLLKGIKVLGFESDFMPYSDAVDIRNKIRPIKFKPAGGEVERFTRPKSIDELENIKKACKMAEDVYEHILETVKPGMTEKELALEIAYHGRKLGSEGDAFDIIATSGTRSALVHGQPSDNKIKKNEMILVDFGCIVNGFRSDITRCFVIGKATKEMKDMYKLLRNSQLEAIKQVRPGMNGKHLDAVSRDMIKEAGFDDNFQHSLGHGLGIVTHEKPIITFRMEDQIVPEGCVLAIEPGVYLPEKWGMRVEDDILVTRNGGEHLTKAPEKLPVI